MDNYNVNRKITNFKDFSANVESEKEELKKIKRSFMPNSDRQQFTDNDRKKYNRVTHKLDDITLDEVDDKLKSIEENYSNFIDPIFFREDTKDWMKFDEIADKINEIIEVLNNK